MEKKARKAKNMPNRKLPSRVPKSPEGIKPEEAIARAKEYLMFIRVYMKETQNTVPGTFGKMAANGATDEDIMEAMLRYSPEALSLYRNSSREQEQN